ncbi:response regulator transcription factor [Tepidiforma thermophila]|uniref:Regulatory LuxR family protein n=1 Tax=Tepidiforma thermophila (strain KCTC 52669 / CGMCC 1.13589 / G233) TaxID=2761530 RepID=A0A2A9HF51_TEPT2|nr:helix-turn-helix transcriptional regulator [Tepidiforma thermophila]PFG74408.1 regulatory LuxR family protein [Tepidiforma thermophila]
MERKLTAREEQIVRLIAAGKTRKETARELGISPHTVRTHLQRTYSRLGVRSNVELANWLAKQDDGVLPGQEYDNDRTSRQHGPRLPWRAMDIARVLRERRTMFLLGTAAAAAIALLVAVSGGGEEPAGGVLPELDVRQSAVAEDAGVTIAARRSHFSGTATVLELEARLEGTETAARLAIEPTGISWSGGPLPDGYGWWSAPAGSPGILRLTPAVPGQEASLEIRRITVFSAEASTPEVRNGTWKLALDLPADLPKRVRTEYLRGASVTDGGVTVTLEGAVRSTSGTLITVRIQAAGPVSHVGEPTMVVDGKVLYGALAATREEGTLLTYTFPPTPFGGGVEVRFGPFEAHGTAELASGSVTIDLGAVLRRANVTAPLSPRETIPIPPTDVLRRDGRDLTPRWVGFSWGMTENSGPGGPTRTHYRYLVLAFEGILEDPVGPRAEWTAVTAAGKPMQAGGWGTGYSKDATGTICCPRTEITLTYDDFNDLLGPVTITYRGAAAPIIRGDWRLKLEP